jgi:hypothetical protein
MAMETGLCNKKSHRGGLRHQTALFQLINDLWRIGLSWIALV